LDNFDWMEFGTHLAEGTVDQAARVSRTDELVPLTGAQRDVWFHQQLDPASTQYNLAQFCRIHGHVDRQRLADAFIRVVACLYSCVPA
jgi:hypothetical protein